MIAAIYARKSTDQNLPDEEKSVTRQIERARAYAAAKGWTVAAEHVYADDGISGGEFLKRPSFLRLMNALKPRAPFHVLIMAEESRLGREAIATSYALKQLTDAGVRVFTYLDDRERTLDSAMDKVMLSLTNFAAEMEREKARQRTYDAIRRKVERSHVGGGLVFGYDNHEIVSPTLGADGKARREHVVRQINEGQAGVVRRIFQLCADGWGLVRIAKALTDEGIPKPKGKGRGWAPSAIREMLHRELYAGHIVWNKMQRIDRDGTRTKRARPESEWLRVDAPALRIVSPALWQAAQAALEQKRAAYLRVAGGRLFGRPDGSRESPYLLSGFSVCALCGGSLFSVRRTHKAHARAYYACFYNRSRGAGACPNALTVPQDDANGTVLATLARDVLTPEMVLGTVDDTVRAWEAQRRTGAPGQRRADLAERLRVLDAELANLTDAVAAGAAFASIQEAMGLRERERAVVQAQLAQFDGHARAHDGLDAGALRRDVSARLTDWQGLLERQPVQARQILRKLLVGRLIFQPVAGTYHIHGQASYGRLIAGLTGESSVVPPA